MPLVLPGNGVSWGATGAQNEADIEQADRCRAAVGTNLTPPEVRSHNPSTVTLLISSCSLPDLQHLCGIFLCQIITLNSVFAYKSLLLEEKKDVLNFLEFIA